MKVNLTSFSLFKNKNIILVKKNNTLLAEEDNLLNRLKLLVSRILGIQKFGEYNLKKIDFEAIENIDENARFKINNILFKQRLNSSEVRLLPEHSVAFRCKEGYTAFTTEDLKKHTFLNSEVSNSPKVYDDYLTSFSVSSVKQIRKLLETGNLSLDEMQGTTYEKIKALNELLVISDKLILKNDKINIIKTLVHEILKDADIEQLWRWQKDQDLTKVKELTKDAFFKKMETFIQNSLSISFDYQKHDIESFFYKLSEGFQKEFYFSFPIANRRKEQEIEDIKKFYRKIFETRNYEKVKFFGEALDYLRASLTDRLKERPTDHLLQKKKQQIDLLVQVYQKMSPHHLNDKRCDYFE